MKTVYWKLKSRGVGYYVVEFWVGADTKNLQTEKFVILDNQRLRYRIAQLTGLNTFELEQVKKK